mmetsp:Transcript_17296/g.26044  ORF Transcript_17296/g.26044 Transcript_17296/m.26044 type:complete len:126 (+) Transcript_17296:1240-1617(+)
MSFTCCGCSYKFTHYYSSLYTIPYSKNNFAKTRAISREYTQVFLDLALESNGVLVGGLLHDRARQTELLQTDVRFRLFCGRDPDTKNVANMFFGLHLTDELLRTLCGSPHDPIWVSRRFIHDNDK